MRKRHENRNPFRSAKLLVLSLVLVFCVGVGGTLAYLTTKTDTITNTFTIGDITYTLTLDGNGKSVGHGGEVGMPDITPEIANANEDQKTASDKEAGGSVAFTVSDPTLTGYTFRGWFLQESEGTAQYPVGTTSIPLEYNVAPATTDKGQVSLILYAQWAEDTYDITYNLNDGSVATDNPTSYTVNTETFTLNNPTRSGYEFIGWTGSNGDEPQTTVTINKGSTGNRTYTANWRQMDFTVSFDTQSDVANPADQTVTYLEPYGDLPTVSRTGYTFDGWYTETDCVNKVTAETIVDKAENHTLYAKWIPHTYTVKYDDNVDANDASVTQPTGSTADSKHTYDVAKNLTENGYERTGYTFLRWNTKPDGTGTPYDDKQSVTNLTAINGDTVTLYAQWGAKSYVIRYNANGGAGSMADQVIKFDVPTALSKNEFTKSDYSFAGWATTPNGKVEYPDEQTVVNLRESGTVTLYAVWLQNSHTVYFDYNGGEGSTKSIQVQNGKEYGVLPEYPVHPTEEVADNKVMTYLFTGWYTERTGGTRVYPETMVNRTDDHKLYAHWEEAPSNNVIQNMVVKNNPDDNKDGVVDDIYLEFTCTSSFEKYNIPLKNLIPGQTYRLTYTASNDASFGDIESGYGTSVYGSYVMSTSALTGGRIENNYNANEYVAQVLADWNSRVEPDGNNDGSQAAINDSLLQGPWKNKEIIFTAKNETMYWTWDFGLMQDHIQNNYNMTDIVLEPVAPEIEFGNKKLILHASSDAKVKNDNSSAYATNFVFDGAGYAETMYFPITGLNKGSTYTITFDHQIKGALINNSSYNYGCGISSVVPTKYGSYMDSVGATWISEPAVFTQLDTKQSVTLTFTATGDTAYWVWNMANCSDGTDCIIDVKVTSFSANHSGKGITYYTAPSSADMGFVPPEEVVEEACTINMEGMEVLSQTEYAPGEIFIMEFCPAEGYTMPETALVQIDGEDRTDEFYYYDEDRGVAEIGIFGEELTEDTSLYIEVIGVPVEEEEIVEEEVPLAPEVPEEPAEPEGLAVALNLTDITGQEQAAIAAGQPYVLTLTPDEGYALPEIIQVAIGETAYEVYTDGQEHRELGEGQTELPVMPTYDPETNTLTIPGQLLTEETTSVAITAQAVVVTGGEDPAEGEDPGEEEDPVVEEPPAEDKGPVTIEVLWELENLVAPEELTITVGEDYSVALVPVEDETLPEMIEVTIGEEVYQVYMDGEEHRDIPTGQTAGDLPIMPTYDPEEGILTIPAELISEDTEEVTFALPEPVEEEVPTPEVPAVPEESAKPEQSAEEEVDAE